MFNWWKYKNKDEGALFDFRLTKSPAYATIAGQFTGVVKETLYIEIHLFRWMFFITYEWSVKYIGEEEVAKRYYSKRPEIDKDTQ